MTLYLLSGTGVFSEASEQNLPAVINIVPEGAHTAQLDGSSLPIIDGKLHIPATIPQGHHTLRVDGRECEGLFVKNGTLRSAGVDARALVASVVELLFLGDRVRALEEKQKEKNVDWLM